MRLRCFAISASIFVSASLFAQNPTYVTGSNGEALATLAMQQTLRLLLEQWFSDVNQHLQSVENYTSDEYYTLVACSNMLDKALSDFDTIVDALVTDFEGGYVSTGGDPHSLAEMLFSLWDDTWQIASFYGGLGKTLVDPDSQWQMPQNVYWIGNNLFQLLDRIGPAWVGAITDSINRLNLDGLEVSVTNDVHIDAQMLEDWETSGANYETWDSFDCLVDEYWDASQYDHPLGYVTTNQWFELNWWERVSCALYSFVSRDNIVDPPDTDTLTAQYNAMGTAIEGVTIAPVDKGVAVRDNLSYLADEIGTFATSSSGRLTIIPVLSLPLAGNNILSFGPVIWDYRDSPLYPIVGAMRAGCLWLWQFIAAIGMLAFFISIGGGTAYFGTWLVKCSSDLKVYPFEWEKVFVNPLRFFHFG